MTLCSWSENMSLDPQGDITVLLCDCTEESQLTTDKVNKQNTSNKLVCLLGNIKKIQHMIFSVVS